MYSLYLYQENFIKFLLENVDKLLDYTDLNSSLRFVITTLVADIGCYMGSLIDRYNRLFSRMKMKNFLENFLILIYMN
jgi:hypothetical protein